MIAEKKCPLSQEEKDQYIELMKPQARWQLEVQLTNAQKDRNYVTGDERDVLDWIIETLVNEIGRRNGNGK